jgi:hypothetical protein
MGCSRTRKDRLNNLANKTATTGLPTLPSKESIQKAPARATLRTLFTQPNRTPQKIPGSTLDKKISFRDDNSTGPRRSEPGTISSARRRLALVGARAGGCAETVARGSRASIHLRPGQRSRTAALAVAATNYFYDSALKYLQEGAACPTPVFYTHGHIWPGNGTKWPGIV